MSIENVALTRTIVFVLDGRLTTPPPPFVISSLGADPFWKAHVQSILDWYSISQDEDYDSLRLRARAAASPHIIVCLKWALFWTLFARLVFWPWRQSSGWVFCINFEMLFYVLLVFLDG
ncbi:hypothetical protein BU23DRAFT_553799 [Bimuria novae-zelandiae CBS 107.79]|uniref:Uncharacterized protein n=1 Tax=Bimuria novae-zelandiae CBS 107.79 TaxID=1447943 RepID=A0A6A5V8R8_9PLEO|nr:hypothetical protein BU23DRAFT_553799 [Bimuria novae-zelandiae CBS 107.79]